MVTKMATKVTFGADPEFFVAKKERPDIPVPACGLFGGAKKSPIFLSPEGGYLEDGCAVEFNVSPADTLLEVRKRLDRLITAFLVLNKDYVICPSASAQFDSKQLRLFPQASVLGCDADFWAYGLRLKPQINMFKNKRFAGGHIHIGLDPWPKDLDPKMFIKAIDCFAYLDYLSQVGTDNYRWEFYGHPGLFRETSYGVEWRSPDNTWALPKEIPDLVISSLQQKILGVVSDVSAMGGEKFNVKLDEWLRQSGIENFLKNKTFAKIPSARARLTDYKGYWEKLVAGGNF
jgi:hypothetical protein